MKRSMTSLCRCLFILGGIVWNGFAWAQGASVPVEGAALEPIRAWQPVSDRRLDGVRGGFNDGSGFVLSFGFDRLVYVGGDLVSSSSVTIPDVAHITRQQAEALVAATGAADVIQIGPGNTVDPAVLQQAAGLGATVIQNSLDSQNIQSVTRLDITLSGLGLLNGVDLQGSLQAAMSSRMGQ